MIIFSHSSIKAILTLSILVVEHYISNHYKVVVAIKAIFFINSATEIEFLLVLYLFSYSSFNHYYFAYSKNVSTKKATQVKMQKII